MIIMTSSIYMCIPTVISISITTIIRILAVVGIIIVISVIGITMISSITMIIITALITHRDFRDARQCAFGCPGLRGSWRGAILHDIAASKIFSPQYK